MNELLDISLLQSLSYVAAAIGVCVAATYYVLVLREQRKNTRLNLETRQAQLFRDFLKTQESYEFTKIMHELFFVWQWKDGEDFMVKYGFGNPDAMTKLTMFFTYWEGLAVMVRRGLMSIDLIYDLNYNVVIGFWEKYSPVVDEWRRRGDSPQLYESVEWLYGEMKRLQAAKGHGYKIPG